MFFWRRNAMTSAKSTSDSMRARPRIIGVWILAAAPGLREMPSSAAAVARPCASVPPRAAMAIAKPAAAPTQEYTSSLLVSTLAAAWARADDEKAVTRVAAMMASLFLVDIEPWLLVR